MTNYDFKNNIFNQDHIESLKNNGIIVLNNV